MSTMRALPGRSPQLDVLYRYASAGARANALGLVLSASRDAFVLRWKRNNREEAICGNLREVELHLMYVGRAEMNPRKKLSPTESPSE